MRRASEQPVSTFSIDVDTGSYANVRRMLRDGVRPPSDAVRAEELINYSDYGHPAPTSLATPFLATTELAPAPWNAQRHLLMVGIKGYDVAKAELPAANLVFLIDTSGSMDSPDKLPLLKQSFAQLVEQLRRRTGLDRGLRRFGRVGTGADAGRPQGRNPRCIERLQAGGSTTAATASVWRMRWPSRPTIGKGVNRVILATDGDFNVGTVDQNALETLVADQRKHGIALTHARLRPGQLQRRDGRTTGRCRRRHHAYIDTCRKRARCWSRKCNRPC